MGKGQINNDIKKKFGSGYLKLNNGSDSNNASNKHLPLADQLAQNREKILENNSKNPEYAISMESRTILDPRTSERALIQLKQIPIAGYAPSDVRGFFSTLDFAEKVYFSMEGNGDRYITNDALFTVKFDAQEYTIPVALFRLCLPRNVKDYFKGNGPSFYKIYKALFDFYGKRLAPQY